MVTPSSPPPDPSLLPGVATTSDRPSLLPPAAEVTGPLLEVTDLCTYFYTEAGEVRAVDGVSFELRRGRTLAVLGESGCGKSVIAYCILRLIEPPGKIVSGSIRLYATRGEPPLELLDSSERADALYDVRGGRAAFIFQEEADALSPVHTIGAQISEAIRLHQKVSRRGAAERALEMLERVGISEPELCLRQYPHELSSGMRQRALIALALVSEPELLIADEPTAALDVTTQAQVLSLLKRLQAESRIGILLITHDVGVVAQMADDVLVMYLGKVVERAPARALLKKPRHPYTMGLLASLPSLSPLGKRLPSMPGAAPAASEIPPGCPFHPRCAHAELGRCNIGAPPVLERVVPASSQPLPGAGDGERVSILPGPPAPGEHAVACWRAREIALERILSLRPAESNGVRSEPWSSESDVPISAERQRAIDREPTRRMGSYAPLPGSQRGEHTPFVEDPTEAAWFEADTSLRPDAVPGDRGSGPPPGKDPA